MVRVWVYGTVIGHFDMSPFEAKLYVYSILMHGEYGYTVSNTGERYYYIDYEGQRYTRPSGKKENLTFDDVKVYEGTYRVL